MRQNKNNFEQRNNMNNKNELKLPLAVRYLKKNIKKQLQKLRRRTLQVGKWGWCLLVSQTWPGFVIFRVAGSPTLIKPFEKKLALKVSDMLVSASGIFLLETGFPRHFPVLQTFLSTIYIHIYIHIHIFTAVFLGHWKCTLVYSNLCGLKVVRMLARMMHLISSFRP